MARGALQRCCRRHDSFARQFAAQLLPAAGFLVAAPILRRLRTEPLEDRRVLSAVTVTNNLDLVNGDTSSIANLIASSVVAWMLAPT